MRLPKWIWRAMRSKRVHRCLAIAPFVVMILVSSYVGIWNFVGTRAVEVIDGDLSKAGLPNQFSDYLNPGIPAKEDVFQHPAMLEKAVLRNLNSYYLSESLPGLASRQPESSIDLANTVNVAGWFDPPVQGGDLEAAGTLLDHLSPELESLEKVADALQRPASSWGAFDDETQALEARAEIEAIMKLRRLAEFAALVAVFELASEQSKQASEKVALMLDAEAHCLHSSPTDISVLIGRSIMEQIKTTIWEGVVRDAWSDDELLEFERRLAQIDPQRGAVEALRGTLAYQRGTMLSELGERREKRVQEWLEGWEWDMEESEARIRGLIWDFGPRGRWDRANAKTAEILLNEGLLDFGQPRTRFSADDVLRFRSQSEQSSGLRYEWKGGSLTMPHPMLQGYDWLERCIKSSLIIETDIALARAGIAIERYRRSNGKPPSSLSELMPDYISEIPMDPWSGKALKYQKQPDGSPHLWSIGVDMIDEKGLPNKRPDQGDVIWITSPIPTLTELVYRRR